MIGSDVGSRAAIRLPLLSSLRPFFRNSQTSRRVPKAGNSALPKQADAKTFWTFAEAGKAGSAAH